MHAPAYLGPLALIFLAGLGAAYALHRLRQPPLIGFIVAGALLGPYGLGLVSDVGVVEGLAELGVVLLLFTVGLELSVGSLRELGGRIWIAGTVQIAGTIALVMAVSLAAGESLPRGLFFGYLVALSSTAIVLKLLVDRREVDSPQGRFLVGILILQDLAVVPMLVSLNVLAGHESGGPSAALGALATTLLTAAALFLAARFAVPRFIGALAGTRQKEIFVVAVLFLVLGSAVATSWAGVSAALGAFLAGLALSDSEYGHQALADIGGFRDAFSAIFFVSIGMLFDWRAFAAEPVAVAILLALILVGKALAGGAAVLALGYPVRIAAIVGVSLAQIGEFSFVLLRQGLAQGLIAPEVYRRFLAAAIVTMLATPFLSAASHGLGRRMAGSPAPADAPGSPALPLREHVLVVGFGHMGETVARLLARAGVPFRVVDLDPDRVRRGRKRGVAIEYGDATNDAVLRRAGIEGAVAAVVVLADLRSTRQVVRHCRTLHPGLFVLARTRYLADIPALAAAGADEVVAEEFESSLEIAGRTLQRLGLPLPWVEAETAEIRQSRQEGFKRFREPGAREKSKQ